MLTYIEMPKMSKTCSSHKWGRHTSYGRADAQLLHDISIRIQWNTSRTLKNSKRKVLKNGSPTIKITNEAPTKVFHLSRTSQLPYSEKHILDYFMYNYI